MELNYQNKMKILKTITLEEYKSQPLFTDVDESIEITDDESKALISRIQHSNSLNLKLFFDSNGIPTITASYFVGVKVFKFVKKQITVIVRPKIENANIFTLFNYAYRKRFFQLNDNVEINKKETDLQLVFIYFYLNTLNEFLKKYFARSFISVTEVLSSKIKGKIQVNCYLSQYYAKLKPQFIPCTYFVLIEDILENQILKETLIIIEKVLKQVKNGSAKKVCLNELKKAEKYFHNVKGLDYYNKNIFNHIRYIGRIKPYKEIHEIAKLFLESFQIDLNKPVAETRFKEFTIDMNNLFELFVIGVLSEIDNRLRYQYPSKFFISNKESKIKPDAVVNTNVVFDAKYKEIYENNKDDSFEIKEVEIKNADIYQMIAYLNHETANYSKAVLVYPVGIDELLEVKKFQKQVYITGIDISEGILKDEIKKFKGKLEEKFFSSQN